MTTAPHMDSMRRLGDLAAVLDTITFPAAREDLLLHAIASHATPTLIGDLRALAESWFEDAADVREALSRL
ncbi:uncharacterized protein DUF2795 [Labedella gwakjiensis]|uniref:DUF2795 domain-containing protein n=1 Tax=Labedella gwakjiensis TaxID=390269 RepID=A0A2P8GS80_9MICO|nr:DUF2795 domain-containing protein [Labedella gwakjiensis]PSL36814.1 uncharacterized protein DUF2795 [Labedella gwakjiensis]RUQ84321.1 DUF2795 domain-containing protein [Labedella gwakjiensis]